MWKAKANILNLCVLKSVTTIHTDIQKVQHSVQAIPEIAAAYLFGSAAEGGAVVNDLDLLVLTYPGINQDQAYFDILYRLTQELSLSEEQIDLVFFELDIDDQHFLEQLRKGRPDFADFINEISNHLKTD